MKVKAILTLWLILLVFFISASGQQIAEGRSANIELIKSLSSLTGILVWPLVALLVLFIFHTEISRFVDGVSSRMADKSSSVQVCLGSAQIAIAPAEVIRPPSYEKKEGIHENLTEDVKTIQKDVKGSPPFDYFFLNHTSFLREKDQTEFRKRTGVDVDHYQIRVIVDSYYEGALKRVLCVEYILHRAYGERSNQVRSDPADKFLLKEVANGEYVLMAKVHLKDRQEPVLLQRYITLWRSGPHLP